jgi:hypothetical protein
VEKRDPGSGTALQRIRWCRGKEIWQKTYRFTQHGIFRLRKKPRDSEQTNRPAGQWIDSEESLYPYNLKTLGCSRVLAPTQLLILVSTADLTECATPLRLCVFNKNQLHQIQIRRNSTKRLKTNYTASSEKGVATKKGEIEADKISFTTRSLAEDGIKAEQFSFLGLKGDFDLYIDREQKIPVQASGNLPGFGRVTLRLHHVELQND